MPHAITESNDTSTNPLKPVPAQAPVPTGARPATAWLRAAAEQALQASDTISLPGQESMQWAFKVPLKSLNRAAAQLSLSLEFADTDRQLRSMSALNSL